jgi:hypothetical protein
VPLWLIIVIAVLAALILLGGVANFVAERRTRAGFDERVSEADRALAAAAAADRGWERAGLEAAARSCWETRRPGEDIHALELVEVIDRPGTDDDHAVFRVKCAGRPARLTLGRRDGAWVEESLVDE